MYQLVLVQPIISLVSSPRWSPLNSALNLECYNQEGQVTPEAKTHDQIRCVQLHNHISCLQSKDLAEKSGQVETKARSRPRNAKDPEGTKENSMHAEEKGRIFLLVIE